MRPTDELIAVSKYSDNLFQLLRNQSQVRSRPILLLAILDITRVPSCLRIIPLGSNVLSKYRYCQKNCENESQVFSIAYKQYLAFLFKTKKCDDKRKKVSKAVEDKREHKCLLKFEKETLEPANHKFIKCYQDKVDLCMYKAFEKKSKKTLKKTLKKKTKKTLKKK